METAAFLVVALLLGVFVGALSIAVFAFSRHRAAAVGKSASHSKLAGTLLGVIATALWLLICPVPVIVFLYGASGKVDVVLNEPVNIGPDVLNWTLAAGLLLGAAFSLSRERKDVGRNR